MNSASTPAQTNNTPVITEVRVIPVAGQDSMLLNLSGAHAPLFTRNVVLLTDSSGNIGLGEVPGGEAIRKAIADTAGLLVGAPVGDYNRVLNAMRAELDGRDPGGRGLQ